MEGHGEQAADEKLVAAAIRAKSAYYRLKLQLRSRSGPSNMGLQTIEREPVSASAIRSSQELSRSSRKGGGTTGSGALPSPVIRPQMLSERQHGGRGSRPA